MPEILTEPKPERDPRIDPKPGDVLRGRHAGDGSACRRMVVNITPYGNVIAKERGSGEQIIGPQEWREWAEHAEVVKCQNS